MKKQLVVTALVFSILFLSSCSDKTEKEEVKKIDNNVQKEVKDKVVLVQIDGHDPKFDIIAAQQQGYWYSRYALGQLMARAGFGEKMVPANGAMPKMMTITDSDFDLEKFKAGDKTYSDGDHFMPPKNPHLIKTVYTSGKPNYTQTFNPNDFATLRWDESTFNKNYTGEAFGWMITKEGEWAKYFHNPNHFGKRTDNFGAQWRMTGMILTAEAKAQINSYLKLKATKKIRLNEVDEIVMLEALSSIYSITNDKDKYPYTYDSNFANNIVKPEADRLYTKLKGIKQYENVKNASLMAQATVWYLVEVKKDYTGLKTDIGPMMNKILGFKPKNIAEKAYMIRGLVEGQRIIGFEGYGIDNLFKNLKEDFDWKKGYFRSQTKYSIDDVGSILGALNALRQFEQKGINIDEVDQMFVSTFESMVNHSGLMRSAPPVEIGKSKWEYEGVDEMYFKYPTIPVPPKAGGKFGVAPVFAGEIEFNPATGKWTITDDTWYTAGGMHTANEMIWFHRGEINGFPEIIK